jgi:hypothetical protein
MIGKKARRQRRGGGGDEPRHAANGCAAPRGQSPASLHVLSDRQACLPPAEKNHCPALYDNAILPPQEQGRASCLLELGPTGGAG